MSGLIIFIYGFLMNCFFILGAPFIMIICLLNSKWRDGLWAKYGFIPNNLNLQKGGIWLHAISFGEVKTIEPLIKALKEAYPQKPIYLSTGTKTGQDLAKKLFENIFIFYCPFDFYFAVNNWLKIFQPQMLLIAETEIWPQLLFSAKERGIFTFLINARLTDKSVKKYKLLLPLFKEVMQRFDKILVQSKLDKKRFLAISATEEQIEVLGNLKFDSIQKMPFSKKEEIKKELNIKEKTIILIAGSTHKGEEKLICSIFAKLCQIFFALDLRLIIAPRHLERLSEIKNICQKENLIYQEKSKINNFTNKQVLLIDTMGELTKFYSIAQITFLGGTWTNIGGHNPLEPIIYGMPLFTGKYTHKITELLEQLNDLNLIQEIQEEKALLEAISQKIKSNSFEIENNSFIFNTNISNSIIKYINSEKP